MAISQASTFTPSGLRKELSRLRMLVDANKCPRDSATIAETIIGLERAKAHINNHDHSIAAWWPDLGRTASVGLLTSIITTALFTMKESSVRAESLRQVLFIELCLFVIAVIATALATSIIKKQTDNALTAVEYGVTIDMLRKHVDPKRNHIKEPNGTYSAILGSEDDMAMIQGVRDRIIGMNLSHEPGGHDPTTASITDQLARLRGRHMSNAFKAELSIIDKMLDDNLSIKATKRKPAVNA